MYMIPTYPQTLQSRKGGCYKKKILFIIDAQNDFCHKDGTLPCKAIGSREQLVKFWENNKFDEVVCTAHSSR